MSCCSENRVDVEATVVSNKVEREVNIAKETESAVVKLLLLGAGESGKSTLFKNLLTIYGSGITEALRADFRTIIYQNCLTCTQAMIVASDKLGNETRMWPESEAAKQSVLEIIPRTVNFDKELVRNLRIVWRDEGIQRTYIRRSEYQLPDCCEYFLDRLDTIGADGYIPSDQDVLRARAPTTGVNETIFKFRDRIYKMIDVGGQRNERRKWIHCFECVSAVIFVASLSEYDLTLFEQAGVSRLNESVSLFEDISNSEWFKSTSIILFLNKSDLFEAKLRNVDLKKYCPDYEGGDDYTKGIEYMTNKYMSVNKNPTKKIYPFVTNATNRDIVKGVFVVVLEIIINASLNSEGLL